MEITEYPGFGGRGTKRPREQENNEAQEAQEAQTIEEIEEIIEIIAIIYKWTFIPPASLNHPLAGIPYIGQTMRSLDIRTRQHKSDARREQQGRARGTLFPSHRMQRPAVAVPSGA